MRVGVNVDRESLAVCVTLLWSVGVVAVWLSLVPRLRWHHWYAAGMSRHHVSAGPITAEWAYKPRRVSMEQAQRETTDAIAATIERAIERQRDAR